MLATILSCLGGIEFIPRHGELVDHHVAEIHQVAQSLLQNIVNVDFVCGSVSNLLFYAIRFILTPSLNTQVHLCFRGMGD
jgi:hypothetical protein